MLRSVWICRKMAFNQRPTLIANVASCLFIYKHTHCSFGCLNILQFSSSREFSGIVVLPLPSTVTTETHNKHRNHLKDRSYLTSTTSRYCILWLFNSKYPVTNTYLTIPATFFLTSFYEQRLSIVVCSNLILSSFTLANNIPL